MFLTAAFLLTKSACHDQVEAFEKAFGPGGLDLSDPSRDPFVVEVALPPP